MNDINVIQLNSPVEDALQAVLSQTDAYDTLNPFRAVVW